MEEKLFWTNSNKHRDSIISYLWFVRGTHIEVAKKSENPSPEIDIAVAITYMVHELQKKAGENPRPLPLCIKCSLLEKPCDHLGTVKQEQ